MPLHAANPALPAQPPSEATVCIVDDEILSVGFSGHIDGNVARQAIVRVRVRELLKERRARVMLCDTQRVTAVDMSSREPGRDLLALVKEHGIHESFCALSSTAVRMLSVALGLAMGVRSHFFSSMDEATAAAKASARRRG